MPADGYHQSVADVEFAKLRKAVETCRADPEECQAFFLIVKCQVNIAISGTLGNCQQGNYQCPADVREMAVMGNMLGHLDSGI